MSALHDRIASQQYLAMPDYHPAVGKMPATPGETPPQSVITYQNGTVLYGTLHPLYTADGAVVPASADVTYPEVVPAGSP